MSYKTCVYIKKRSLNDTFPFYYLLAWSYYINTVYKWRFSFKFVLKWASILHIIKHNIILISISYYIILLWDTRHMQLNKLACDSFFIINYKSKVYKCLQYIEKFKITWFGSRISTTFIFFFFVEQMKKPDISTYLMHFGIVLSFLKQYLLYLYCSSNTMYYMYIILLW